MLHLHRGQVVEVRGGRAVEASSGPAEHRLAALLGPEDAERTVAVQLNFQGRSAARVFAHVPPIPTFLNRLLLTCFYLALEDVTTVHATHAYEALQGRVWVLRVQHCDGLTRAHVRDTLSRLAHALCLCHTCNKCDTSELYFADRPRCLVSVCAECLRPAAKGLRDLSSEAQRFLRSELEPLPERVRRDLQKNGSKPFSRDAAAATLLGALGAVGAPPTSSAAVGGPPTSSAAVGAPPTPATAAIGSAATAAALREGGERSGAKTDESAPPGAEAAEPADPGDPAPFGTGFAREFYRRGAAGLARKAGARSGAAPGAAQAGFWERAPVEGAQLPPEEAAESVESQLAAWTRATAPRGDPTAAGSPEVSFTYDAWSRGGAPGGLGPPSAVQSAADWTDDDAGWAPPSARPAWTLPSRAAPKSSWARPPGFGARPPVFGARPPGSGDAKTRPGLSCIVEARPGSGPPATFGAQQPLWIHAGPPVTRLTVSGSDTPAEPDWFLGHLRPIDGVGRAAPAGGDRGFREATTNCPVRFYGQGEEVPHKGVFVVLDTLTNQRRLCTSLPLQTLLFCGPGRESPRGSSRMPGECDAGSARLERWRYAAWLLKCQECADLNPGGSGLGCVHVPGAELAPVCPRPVTQWALKTGPPAMDRHAAPVPPSAAGNLSWAPAVPADSDDDPLADAEVGLAEDLYELDDAGACHRKGRGPEPPEPATAVRGGPEPPDPATAVRGGRDPTDTATAVRGRDDGEAKDARAALGPLEASLDDRGAQASEGDAGDEQAERALACAWRAARAAAAEDAAARSRQTDGEREQRHAAMTSMLAYSEFETKYNNCDDFWNGVRARVLACPCSGPEAAFEPPLAQILDEAFREWQCLSRSSRLKEHQLVYSAMSGFLALFAPKYSPAQMHQAWLRLAPLLQLIFFGSAAHRIWSIQAVLWAIKNDERQMRVAKTVLFEASVIGALRKPHIAEWSAWARANIPSMGDDAVRNAELTLDAIVRDLDPTRARRHVPHLFVVAADPPAQTLLSAPPPDSWAHPAPIAPPAQPAQSTTVAAACPVAAAPLPAVPPSVGPQDAGPGVAAAAAAADTRPPLGGLLHGAPSVHAGAKRPNTAIQCEAPRAEPASGGDPFVGLAPEEPAALGPSSHPAEAARSAKRARLVAGQDSSSTETPLPPSNGTLPPPSAACAAVEVPGEIGAELPAPPAAAGAAEGVQRQGGKRKPSHSATPGPSDPQSKRPRLPQSSSIASSRATPPPAPPRPSVGCAETAAGEVGAETGGGDSAPAGSSAGGDAAKAAATAPAPAPGQAAPSTCPRAAVAPPPRSRAWIDALQAPFDVRRFLVGLAPKSWTADAAAAGAANPAQSGATGAGNSEPSPAPSTRDPPQDGGAGVAGGPPARIAAASDGQTEGLLDQAGAQGPTVLDSVPAQGGAESDDGQDVGYDTMGSNADPNRTESEPESDSEAESGSDSREWARHLERRRPRLRTGSCGSPASSDEGDDDDDDLLFDDAAVLSPFSREDRERRAREIRHRLGERRRRRQKDLYRRLPSSKLDMKGPPEEGAGEDVPADPWGGAGGEDECLVYSPGHPAITPAALAAPAPLPAPLAPVEMPLAGEPCPPSSLPTSEPSAPPPS
jgi:hypothetical protein